MRARESRRRNGSILVSIEPEKHGKLFSGFQHHRRFEIARTPDRDEKERRFSNLASFVAVYPIHALSRVP
jgi:hypothetical protein